jgi:nitrogen fixation NifU-like protein
MEHNLDADRKCELSALYQEVILEHFKRPRHKGRVEHCQFCQEGKNPLCGDTITVFCQVGGEAHDPRLSLHFEGSGCSISQASASIMCESLQNISLNEAKNRLKQAESIYSGKQSISPDDFEEDVEALHGVSQFPVRIKCAALPWKTLEILIAENFDAQGHPKQGCNKITNCVQNNSKKLKVVSTEN